MARSSSRVSWPLFTTGLVWLGAWIGFSERLEARPDFQVFLYLLEGLAWLLAAGLTAGVLARVRFSKPWLRAAWWAVGTAFLLFPLGAIALGAAEELCGIYRNWNGPARALSAQYLFREFTGMRLDQGFIDGWRNVIWAMGLGFVSSPFWGVSLFGEAWLLCSGEDARQGDADQAT